MKKQSKKRLSLMLTAIMLLSNMSYASNGISGHWASETMARWQSQGLIKGDEKGNLNPDKSITRAEFITIVNKVMAYNKTGDKIKNYKDLKQNDWYYSQIMTALEQGYIKGTSADTMSPNKDITRQEVMVIVNNIAGLNQSKFDLSVVKDQDKIASWAKNAATNMIANGYITGYQGNINPNKAMKRAEAITLLDAYKQNNRTISFQGQYSLGKANKVTVLTGNIQINESQIKELIINKDAQGKIELSNTKIDKITNNSKEIKIYLEGKEVQIQDGKIVEQQTNQDKQYKDGKYTGTAKGYKSDVEVEVEIKDGKIVKIDVKQQEDPLYWNVAKTVIDRILQKQTPQVDASTGATITSKAIMYAVEEALEKALIKKQEIQGNKELKDGKYIGQATGYKGILRVEVEIKDGKITKITLLSHSDDAGYIDSAKNILKDIQRKQTADVTAISGATYSSDGIKNAVKDALEQAKGKTTKPGESEYAKKNLQAPGSGGGGGGGSSTPKEEKDFTDLVDGIYEGQGQGYKSIIKVKVTVSNKKIAKIELLENKDDQNFFDQDKADKIAKNIIDKQSTAVDTIAGATRSSTGFINAVANALEFAGRIKIISKDTDGKNKSILTGKITGQNITVKNLTVNEDLTIDKQVGDSNVTLENVTVKANLNIHGGGSNSIVLKKVTVEGNTLIQKDSGQKVRLLTQEDSQLKGKVLINTPAIIETVGNDEIQTVEIPRSYSGQEETQIRANIGTLDIKTVKANIKIEKQSKIKHIELPREVGQYKQGQNKYEKGEFKLEIENPDNIQSGSNKNIEGTFKFLKKEEVKNLDNKTYKDGEYFGDGFGFVERKPIPVKVTVSGGKITDISLVEEELTKVDTEWKAGQKAKIDDGESYALRFDYVKDLVKKNQNPNALAYRLGTLRDVLRLVRKGVGATDIAGYNANLDKIVGKHEFGYHNQKLQAGDEHNINNKLMLLLRTFAVEDLGYDKAEYDAISGATFTAIGTSQAISNALKKADDSINFYDMRVKDGYKDKFVEGKPIDLSDLKVDFYLKDKTVKTVPYSEFETNGLKVLDRDTDKEIKNGTLLTKDNFGVSTLSVVNLKVVHEESKSVKLLKKMTVLKGGVLANIDKFQVKPKDSNDWIDTEGFDNTVSNGEINDAQHLKFPNAKAQDLLHKELEFRIIAKRTDNNEQVIFTTRPVNSSDKFIYPQKSNQAYRIYINEDSLKDANGTALKVDEKNSKYFRIFLKDNSNTPKLSETYKEVPSEITVTTGTVLTEDSLKAAFKDLPAGSKLNFDAQKAKELTESVGDNKKLDVSIDFTDYSSKEYTLTINVKEQGHSTLAQQYNETAHTVTLTTGAMLEIDRAKKALPNLPFNTQVEITQQPNTSVVGDSSATVRLTFTDNSTKDMTIPVIVKEAAQGLAGKFEQKENSLSIDVVVELDESILKGYGAFADKLRNATKLSKFNEDNIKRELKVKTDDAYNTYGNIEVEVLEEPNRKVIGQTTGKVKLKFNDNTSLELDIPVNVTPMPVVFFTLKTGAMKKTYKIEENFDFSGLKGFVRISTTRDISNTWTTTGAPIYVPYKDFEYFGLKVVKTGTNEEVKQGSPVRDAVKDGKIDLSVFRELGVISQDEYQKKVPQIEGLELEKLADSFNNSSYATNGIEVETLVKPNDKRFQELEVYTKKGFEPSLKIALKEIEKNYGEVEVEEVSKPDLTQLGDTTAKIKLKFKDDSVSKEIDIKVKVKELPVFNFTANNVPKKEYNKNDKINLKMIKVNVYLPNIDNAGNYSNEEFDYEKPVTHLENKDFKYFGLKIVKKDTEDEVIDGTKIEDLLSEDKKKINIEVYCKKIYSNYSKHSNRIIIKNLSLIQ